MDFSIKVYSRKFSGENRKKAYLTLCKWLASNIISKDELKNISYKVENVKDTELPTFELVLYVGLNEKEIRERNCRICLEAHNLYYLNMKADCNSCKAAAYEARLDELIKEKKSYTVNKINTIISKGCEE